jgi:hypothetical protein
MNDLMPLHCGTATTPCAVAAAARRKAPRRAQPSRGVRAAEDGEKPPTTTASRRGQRGRARGARACARGARLLGGQRLPPVLDRALEDLQRVELSIGRERR